jgi:ribonuclease HI
MATMKGYVDDLLLQVQGPAHSITETAGDMVEDCLSLLRENQLEVSRGTWEEPGGKSGVLISQRALEPVVKARFRKLGIALVDSLAYLGVDTGRKRAGRLKLKEMCHKWAKRTGKLKGLLKATKGIRGGVKKVLKNGLWPSITYGARCLGLPANRIKTCRSSMARLLPGGHGSTTLKLALHGLEPMAEFSGYPVTQWARKAWEGKHRELQARAWRKQAQWRLKPSSADVKGPAGAVAMAIREAGWSWPAPNTFLTKENLVIDAEVTCPEDVRAMYSRDIAKQQWLKWTSDPRYSSLAPAPLIRPIQNWLRKRGTTKMDQGVARALVTRGAVTQSVLHEWGWAASPTCQECRTEDGTPQHRYHSCEASRSTRWGSEHRAWQHQADDDCKKGEKVLLWTRGLAKDPSSEWAFKPPPAETCCKVIKAADFEWDGTISGDIYPDGSKLGHAEWAQCGWAWVTLSGGKVRVGQFGALPISLPVQRRIKRAELWAFHQALCCVLPPAVIHTDHLGIEQGLTKGKQWCNDGRRAHADIWRMVWWQLEDQSYGEGADIEVRHVKAHRSKAQKQALQDEARQHSAGNDEADHFAKLGADADCNWGREAAIVEAGAKAQWALAYLTGQHRARVGKAWEDVDSDVARPKPKSSLVVGPQHPH